MRWLYFAIGLVGSSALVVGGWFMLGEVRRLVRERRQRVRINRG